MMSILKRLLLILATLGFGALAYALLRAEGERALRPATGGPRQEPPGAPPPAPVEAPRRCAAVTASGKRCARETQPGSEYCWQHGG
jgi:hypothetical protein